MTPSPSQSRVGPVSGVYPSIERGARFGDAVKEEPRGPRVQLVEARPDGVHVVRLEASTRESLLADGHRALSAIGVQIVHTKVTAAMGWLVQELHLVDGDGSSLCPTRLLTAIAALFVAAAALESRRGRRAPIRWC